MTNHADTRPGHGRAADLAYFAVLAVFLCFTVFLAAVNKSPGSPTSENNMDTARFIAEGRGFISNIVQQHFVVQPLPGPEVVLPPALPYVIAAVFYLFGISMAWPVVLNALAVLASSLLLRRCLLLYGLRRYANFAGAMILLSSNYQLISLWNNNDLVAVECGLLLLFSAFLLGRTRPLAFALGFAVVGALAYLTKPTMILPFAALTLLFAHVAHHRLKLGAGRTLALLLLVGVVFLALTSPYWGRNMMLYGQPVYSPWTLVRLAERYDGLPWGAWWTVRYGHPLGYGEVIDGFGLAGFLAREAKIWLRLLGGLISLNPFLLLACLAGAALAFARSQRLACLLALALLIEPIFAVLYWQYEVRYLWPAYPVMLFLIGLAVRQAGTAPAGAPARRFGPALLAAGLVYGVASVLLPMANNGQGFPWIGYYLQAAHAGTPGWQAAVETLPKDALVCTDDPFAVAWYTRRRAVLCPCGERADFETFLRHYPIDAYLATPRFDCRGGGSTPFRADELAPIARGAAPPGGAPDWSLFAYRRAR